MATAIFSGCGKSARVQEAQPAWKPNRDSLLAHPPEGMRLVRGGRFRMGGLDGPYDSLAETRYMADSGYAVRNAAGLSSRQLPSHWVELGDFFMDTTEVMEKEWREYMGAPPETGLGDEYPVSRVSWIQAILFCNRKSRHFGLDTVYKWTSFNISVTGIPTETGLIELNDTDDVQLVFDMTANGFRLPTEAEFEYAARAGSDTRYPWGQDPGSTQAWWGGHGGEDSINPAASRRPNAWGLYDLIGNVPEWVNDGYSEEPYYASAPVGNPYGPEDGRSRFSALVDGRQPAAGIFPGQSPFRVYRGADRRKGETVLLTPRNRNWTDPGQKVGGFRTVLQVR